MKQIVTFGTFDLMHIGHVSFLLRCHEAAEKRWPGENTKLDVFVSSDEFNYQKKGRYPIYSQKDRSCLIWSQACVRDVFIEDAWDTKKRPDIMQYDLMVMGSDWDGKFDDSPIPVEYIPRTSGVSTSEIIERIKKLE